MPLYKLSALLATLTLASARDAGKLMKTIPTISNSLVNLGKMEISIHLNGKHQDSQPLSENNIHTNFYSPPVEESCPCNSFKPPPFLSDPSEIINKILKNNDLFKDPTSSTCCESTEHMQESTIVFEVNPNIPNLSTLRNSNNAAKFPNFLQGPLPLFSNFIPLTSAAGSKPKTVEIFMFPKKNGDVGSFDFANLSKPRKAKDTAIIKSDFQIIKDGRIKQTSTSVKKDLAVTEKKGNGEFIEAPKEELQTDGPPVTKVDNAL